MRSEADVVCAKQADVGLDRLLNDVLTARGVMQAELGSPCSQSQRQVIARGRLLESLEAYTSGLTARGLSAPPRLRDELALQRSLVTTRR